MLGVLPLCNEGKRSGKLFSILSPDNSQRRMIWVHRFIMQQRPVNYLCDLLTVRVNESAVACTDLLVEKAIENCNKKPL